MLVDICILHNMKVVDNITFFNYKVYAHNFLEHEKIGFLQTIGGEIHGNIENMNTLIYSYIVLK